MMTVDVGIAVSIAIGLLEGVETDPLLALHTHTACLLRAREKGGGPKSGANGLKGVWTGTLKDDKTDIFANSDSVPIIVQSSDYGSKHRDESHVKAHKYITDTLKDGDGKAGAEEQIERPLQKPRTKDATNILHPSKAAHAKIHTHTSAEPLESTPHSHKLGSRRVDSSDAPRSQSRERSRSRERSERSRSRAAENRPDRVRRTQRDTNTPDELRLRRTRSARTPSREGRVSRDGGEERESGRVYSRNSRKTPTPSAAQDDARERRRASTRSYSSPLRPESCDHRRFTRTDSTDSTASTTSNSQSRHERRRVSAGTKPPTTRTYSRTERDRSSGSSREPRASRASRSISMTDTRLPTRTPSRSQSRADTPSRSRNHEDTPSQRGRSSDRRSRTSSRAGGTTTPTHHNTRTHTPTGHSFARSSSRNRARTPTLTHTTPTQPRTLEEMQELAKKLVNGEAATGDDPEVNRKVLYLREAAAKLQQHTGLDNHVKDLGAEEVARVRVPVDPRVYEPYGGGDVSDTSVSVAPSGAQANRSVSQLSEESRTEVTPLARSAEAHAKRKEALRESLRKSAKEKQAHTDPSAPGSTRTGEKKRAVKVMRRVSDATSTDGTVHGKSAHSHRPETRKKERTRKMVLVEHVQVHETPKLPEQNVSDTGSEGGFYTSAPHTVNPHGGGAQFTDTESTHEYNTHPHTVTVHAHDPHGHTVHAQNMNHQVHRPQSRNNGDNGILMKQRIPKDVLEFLRAKQKMKTSTTIKRENMHTHTHVQGFPDHHPASTDTLSFEPTQKRVPPPVRVNFSARVHHSDSPRRVSDASIVNQYEFTTMEDPSTLLTPQKNPILRPPRSTHTPTHTRTHNVHTRGYENLGSTASTDTNDSRRVEPPSEYATMTSWTFNEIEAMSVQRIRHLASTLPNITHVNTEHARGWDEALYRAVLDNWPLLTSWDLGIFPTVSDSGLLLTKLSNSSIQRLTVDGEIPSAINSRELRVLKAQVTPSMRLFLAGNPALEELTLSWQVVTERLVGPCLEKLSVKQVSNPGALIGCPKLAELQVESLNDKTFCTTATVLGVNSHKVSNANMDKFPRAHTLKLGKYASLEEGFISRRVSVLEMDGESEMGLPLKYYLPRVHTLICGMHDMRALSFMSLHTLTLRCFVDEGALKQTIINCPKLEHIYLREPVPWMYKPYSSVDLWETYRDIALCRSNVTLYVDQSYERKATPAFLSLLREGRVAYAAI